MGGNEISLNSLIKNSALLFLFVYVTFLMLPRDFAIGGGGWWMCLDYIASGNLYGSGQTFCAQPPIIYYLGFYLEKFLGEGLLLYGLLFFVFCAQAITFWVFRRVALKHNVYNFHAFSLLYIFLIYRFIASMESSIGLGFFALGFYYLYFRESGVAALFSGLLFSLSVFTKFTFLTPVFFIFVYLILDRSICYEKKSFSFSLDVGILRLVCFSLVVVLFSGFVLKLIFPQVYEYTVLGQANIMDKSLGSEFFSQLASRNIILVFGLLLFVFIGYCLKVGFFTRETLLFPLIQIIVLVHAGLFLMAFSDTNIGSYYMIASYPFLLISMLVVRGKNMDVFTALFICIVVFSVFYSPLWDVVRSGFEGERFESIKVIQWGLHFIPPQTGRVLSQAESFDSVFLGYDTPIRRDQVDLIKGSEHGFAMHEDAAWGPRIRELFKLNHSYASAYGNLSDKEAGIRNDILSGKYSALVYGPPEWLSVVRILQTMRNETDEMFCPVYVPNFLYEGDGREFTVVLLDDEKACINMKKDMTRYYLRNYQRICQIGGKAEKVVKGIIVGNGYKIKLKCDETREYRFSQREEHKLQVSEMVFILIMFLPLKKFLGLFK